MAMALPNEQSARWMGPSLRRNASGRPASLPGTGGRKTRHGRPLTRSGSTRASRPWDPAYHEPYGQRGSDKGCENGRSVPKAARQRGSEAARQRGSVRTVIDTTLPTGVTPQASDPGARARERGNVVSVTVLKGPFGEPGMNMGPGQPDAGVVDGQYRSMSRVQGGCPDRIGLLFDDACPTAVTPGYRYGPNGYEAATSQNAAARAFPDVVGYIVGWSVLASV